MIKFFRQKNRGFTLVETMVAISIFTMSVLSVLVVLSSGISNTTYAKNKIIAQYLGQEGVEYMRNMRDTFLLYTNLTNEPSNPNGWDAFRKKLITAACDQANGCYLDDQSLDYTAGADRPMAKTLSLITCSTGTCPALKYNSANGRYNYATGTNTNFIRTVKIQCPNNDCTTGDEIKISVDVSWVQGSGTFHNAFSENLFNWIQ